VDAVSTTIAPVLGKVSRQGAVVFLTRGAALLLGITSTILLSRLLGPSGFGKFRLGSVVVQLVTAFCVLGLDRALLRYVPILETRGENAGRLLIRGSSVVFVISLALSAVLMLAAPILATSYFHSPEMASVIRVFSLQVPVLALFRFLAGAVTAAKRFDFASKITNILSPAVFVFLLTLVALVWPSLKGTIAARILAQLVAGGFLAVFLVQHYAKLWRTEPSTQGTFKSYLLLSMPLFLIGLGFQLLHQIDTIMLGHFVSPKEVGIYSVAFKVSAFVLIGLEILLPIVAPLFSQFWETHDDQSLETLFGTATKWLCYSALVIFVCIAIFRLDLLHVFGKGFTAGSTVLLILATGQLVNAVTGPTGVLLTMTGKQKWELANTVSILAFNFLLNLLLIPKMGMTGAAIATAISIATINGLKLVEVYMLFGLLAYNLKYLKGIVAIGAAGLVGYLLRGWLFNSGYSPYSIMPLGGIGFLITVTVGFWLFGLDAEDKVALTALRRRRPNLTGLPVEKVVEAPLS
jgi:O-antigen/teichoic acid export membrane protein